MRGWEPWKSMIVCAYLILLLIITKRIFKDWANPAVLMTLVWASIIFVYRLELIPLNRVENRTLFIIALGVTLFDLGVGLTKRLTHTQIIHMSTDCVFSGKRGQYTEDDFRDGMTFYDRTKALGEIVNDKDLTMRQSIVGPDINQNGIGLMNWFLQQHGEVTGYTGAMWTGQTTLQLAKTMEAAAKERARGLYNMVPDTNISKCDLLGLFNKYIRKEKITIIPVDKMSADKSLKRTKWDFDYHIPDYETMIVELADWMRKHKALYPHYEL